MARQRLSWSSSSCCFVAVIFFATLYFGWMPDSTIPSTQDPTVTAHKTSPNYSGLFESPFCEPDGSCHEQPDVPSPRTIFSAWSVDQYQSWWQFHAKLNLAAEAYAARRRTLSPSSSSSRCIVFLGDSITESWLGTGLGSPKDRTKGVPSVLQEKFTSQGFDPLILGASGDQTQHLLWRLQNGQLLPEYAQDDQCLFVALIGTNNLGSGELPRPTAAGILAVVRYVLEHTKGKVLLLDVLPRGDGSTVLPRVCPPRCQSNGKPFRSFTPALRLLNEVVRKEIPDLQSSFGIHRLTALDCGLEFFHEDTEVPKSLMPDFLHPNKKGYQILADCIRSFADSA